MDGARESVLRSIPEPRLLKIARVADTGALDVALCDAHTAVLDELERRHPEIADAMLLWFNEEHPTRTRAQAVCDAIEGDQDACLSTLIDVAYPPA